MPQPEDKRCEHCRYSAERRDGRFECRKNAPKAFTGSKEQGDTMYGWFPVMSATEWCGEFQPQNPETMPEGAPILALLTLSGDLVAARALADKLRE